MANPLREWLEAFPTEYASSRLEELDRRRAAIEEEMGQLRAYLDTLGSLAPAATNGNGSGQAPASGREAVEAVMRTRPGHVWQRREILEELVRRGWAEPGEPGRKKLGSMLYHMVRLGRVERPEENRYRLPDDRQGVLAA